MKRILCGALLLAFPWLAHASKWVYLTNSSATAQVWIDLESVAKANGGKAVKAWFLFSDTEEQTQKAYPYKKYKATKQLNYFNCAEKSTAVIQNAFYAGEKGAGEMVDSFSVSPIAAQYNDVIPDTIGELMLKAACQKY